MKDGKVFTPPLSEGCIAGVMRAHILANAEVAERECTIKELEQADELFLTNAVTGHQMGEGI